LVCAYPLYPNLSLEPGVFFVWGGGGRVGRGSGYSPFSPQVGGGDCNTYSKKYNGVFKTGEVGKGEGVQNVRFWSDVFDG